MSKEIAFFDFDGTITNKDTMLEILKFHKGWWGMYWGLFSISPWLIAMKLGIISNSRAKERLLTRFFKNMPVEEFQRTCDQFSEQVLPRLLRPGALVQIQKYQQLKTPVVIVTASAENWVKKWCCANGIVCIATRLDTSDGRITGKISGENCHGMEKVRRIKEYYDLREYQTIYAYGDTNGDKPMLALATIAYYKPFR